MNDFNNKEMLFYLLIHATIFVFSNIFKLIGPTKNKKIISSTNNETNKIEQLQNEINALKNEAEIHNNQNEFVMYSKIKRKINKLEEELQLHKNNQKNNSYQNFENENKEIQFFANMINSYSSSSSIYTNFFIWIIVLIEYYLLREKYFIFNYDNYKGNILIEYYHNKNDTLVKIPIKIILICETIVLNQLNNAFKNIF